jgi:hypothetical protein
LQGEATTTLLRAWRVVKTKVDESEFMA